MQSSGARGKGLLAKMWVGSGMLEICLHVDHLSAVHILEAMKIAVWLDVAENCLVSLNVKNFRRKQTC